MTSLLLWYYFYIRYSLEFFSMSALKVSAFMHRSFTRIFLRHCEYFLFYVSTWNGVIQFALTAFYTKCKGVKASNSIHRGAAGMQAPLVYKMFFKKYFSCAKVHWTTIINIGLFFFTLLLASSFIWGPWGCTIYVKGCDSPALTLSINMCLISNFRKA